MLNTEEPNEENRGLGTRIAPFTYDIVKHEPEEGYHQQWKNSAMMAKKLGTNGTYRSAQYENPGLSELTFAMGGLGSLAPVQSVAKAVAPLAKEAAIYYGIEHAYQKSKETDEGVYDTLWNRMQSMVPPSHLTQEEQEEWKKTFMQNHFYSSNSPHKINVTSGFGGIAYNLMQKNPALKMPNTMPLWFAGDIANELASVMATGDSRQADVYR